MQFTHLIVLAALATGVAGIANDDLVKKDMAALQGEWSMVSAE